MLVWLSCTKGTAEVGSASGPVFETEASVPARWPAGAQSLGGILSWLGAQWMRTQGFSLLECLSRDSPPLGVKADPLTGEGIQGLCEREWTRAWVSRFKVGEMVHKEVLTCVQGQRSTIRCQV